MYRQILMSPEDRRYQLIRWRFSPEQPVATYQLNTVTYGVSSSPYLAIRTLLALADLGRSDYPLASQAITSDLYVDDIIGGAASVSEALELQRQLIGLFQLGRFELRKWASNSSSLLQHIHPEHCQTQARSFADDSDNTIKILGLKWNPVLDFFSFEVTPRHVDSANNPADAGSRGLFPKEILSSSLWWAGPKWLSLSTDAWPSEPANLTISSNTDLEQRKVVLVAQTPPHFATSLLANFSSLRKILGIIAYLRRFVHNVKNRPASSDPNDLTALTPGHFLTLEPLTAAPDPDLSHFTQSRLSRWQLVQQLHQSFWARWRNKYLHTLYQKSKWTHDTSSDIAHVGTLVLIKDELSPPLKWRLGRILQLFPGKDGVARVASVNTIQGAIRSPLVKLCALPAQ